MLQWVRDFFRRGDALVPLALTIGVVGIGPSTFPLSHTLLELLSVVVAGAIMAVLWHTHDYVRNNLLFVLACGFFWLGTLDLAHTLAAPGMGPALTPNDLNVSLQFWIGARWLEAGLLLGAVSCIDRPISKRTVFGGFGLIAAGLAGAILGGIFPDTVREGAGLTDFKVVSEILVVVLLGVAFWRLSRCRQRMNEDLFHALMAMIFLLFLSELAVSFQQMASGSSDIYAHIFKLWAFWIIYVAIVRHPLGQIFRATVQQKALAERLRESERQFRTLVANLPCVCYRCAFDTDWTMEFISDHASALTGYPAAGFIGNRERSFASVIYPDDGARVAEAVAAAVEARRPFGVEYRIVRADGAVRWVFERGQAVFGTDGTVRCLDGVIEDVTDRILADRKLRQAASVFEHCSEGIVITDPQARIIEVNQAFTELTGFDRAEVLGQTPAVLNSGRQSSDFYDRMWASLRESGVWKGELWNRRKDGSLYAELLTISTIFDADGKPLRYVGIFSDITRLKQDQAQLEHLASHDHLTKTPNRLLLADRLRQAQARAKRQGGVMAVAYLDLDGFKAVNDRLGHDTGDQLLVEVATRLTACLRASDTVARTGGDEFVLVLTDLTSLAECRRVFGRVLAAVARPYRVAGTEIQVSASIGVACCRDGEDDPDLMLRWADVAMYKAKESGRNRIHYHRREPQASSGPHLTLQEQFGQALADGKLELHYQPKIHLRRGSVVGVEGLIRWRTAEGQWQQPADFLPAIEGTEHDLALGRWVLHEAVRQLAAWQRDGLDLSISVNISAWHLGEDGFYEGLEEVVSAHPSQCQDRLELEILETTALGDIERVSAVLAQCRRLGVRFALDDFGTGYSSLENFRKLPVDVIKIDRSFVGDMLVDAEAYAIVEGIISLSRAFRRQVVAEGMETAECGRALLRLGCEHAQGYGIARPMPADAIPGWVAACCPHALARSLEACDPAA